MAPFPELKTLNIALDSTTGVAHLQLHRPTRSNAVDRRMFVELALALAALDENKQVSAVLLSGEGKNFCSGIDLESLSTIILDQSDRSGCEGRKRAQFLDDIKQMQDAFTSLELCRKPVVAAIHGHCIGAGVDMVTACDLRYSTANAQFCVKEVDLAITADLGTLQRLPALIGEGNTRELALTARSFDGREAKHLGLVQQVFENREALMLGAMKVATDIAAKSPLAVYGTKAVLVRARKNKVEEGLEFVRVWNAAMLDSADIREVLKAKATRRRPFFAKL